MIKGNKINIVIAIIVLITIASVILDYYLPAMGDDLMKWSYLGLEEYNPFSRTTLKFIAGHIIGCNGRIFDWLGPVVIDFLPRFIVAVIMGVMVGIYLLSIVINIKSKDTCFNILIIAIAISIIPWWDSMWLRVCHFNYIWATLFDLLFIYFFFREKKVYLSRWSYTALIILAVCAGASHEMNGVAMSIALVTWYIIKGRYNRLMSVQRYMAIGLFLGTLINVVSPSIWHRAGTDILHDGIVHLLLTTLPVYIILVSTAAILYFIPKRRQLIKLFFKSDDILVMAVAATVAATIAVVSGIPGRTGLFTESISIILLARLFLSTGVNIKQAWRVSIAVIATVWIVLHYAVSIYWQAKIYKEVEDVRKLYMESTDGVVYYDYTGRYDVSPLTLYRVKGVPDADDWWLSTVMNHVYSNTEKEFIVLPTKLQGIIPLDSVVVGDYTLYSELPKYEYAQPDSFMVQRHGKSLKVIRKLPTGWISAPLVQDPGDIVVLDPVMTLFD